MISEGTLAVENRTNDQPSFLQRTFSRIEDKETATKLAKEGALAGLILCLMEIGGLVFGYFGTDPTTGHKVAVDAFDEFLYGAIVLIPVILVLCWRVKIGKGYISSLLLLGLFIFEVLAKISDGTTNVGWMFFYFYVAVGLINGSRACWYLRKYNQENTSADNVKVANLTNQIAQSSTPAPKISAVGWGLIVLAFATPIAASIMGYGNAAQAGEQVGKMVVGLGALVLVTSLALRGRSSLVHSYGRVVAGALFMLWALVTTGQYALQASKNKTFYIEYQQLQVQQAAHFTELGKRFDAVDLTTVLIPENVTSAAGIASGREIIAEYRALLAERRSMLANHFAESEQFFNTRSPTEADRLGAVVAMEKGKGATIKTYGDLDRVQSAVATAMSDLLDWAATQSGKLKINKGQLALASQQQQTELNALLQKLESAETLQQHVLQETAMAQQKAQAVMDENNERLRKVTK